MLLFLALVVGGDPARDSWALRSARSRTGGVVGGLAWLLVGHARSSALLAGVVAFIFTLIGGVGGSRPALRGGFPGGGWGGGGWGGGGGFGGGGGGGFSGGGGSFGGGGASGSW